MTMRTLACLMLIGCSCPMGFERIDGECAPAGATGEGTSDDPLSADNFVRRFHIQICQGLEACKDAQTNSDYFEVDCEEEVPFDTSCPFDLDAAEQCLGDEWTCDYEGFTIILYYSPACDDVFRCS